MAVNWWTNGIPVGVGWQNTPYFADKKELVALNDFTMVISSITHFKTADMNTVDIKTNTYSDVECQHMEFLMKCFIEVHV